MHDETGFEAESSEILEGTLESVRYSNEQTGFVVARLQPANDRDLVTVVGRLGGPRLGQPIRLWGQWVMHPQYGRQFKFWRWHVTPPSTLEGLLRYLGSGAIQGVRSGMAERIVKAFGDETLFVLEKQPERLREVKGLGTKRAKAIQRVWDASREQREILLFLNSHGIAGAMADRIMERYGAETPQVVASEPYRMIREIHGIAFRTADAIALKMGVPPDSTSRAEAALSFLLDEAAKQGHLFAGATELTDWAASRLQIPPDVARMALRKLLDEGQLIAGGPADAQLVYLPVYHEAERGTAACLLGMGQRPSVFTAAEIQRAAGEFERELGLTLHPLQLEGLLALAASRVLIITGGPGTGKTTLLRCFLRLLEGRGLATALAAPTGRAAKRMEETSDRPAMTIHRLLGFDPISGGFIHDEAAPLKAQAVIVDEASMLDMLLAHSLVRALKPETYLILMGDVDQLPAVGPGSVLRDLIASGCLRTAVLKQVFRQGEESTIQVNAHRINQGLMPSFHKSRSSAGQDFVMLERDDPVDVARTVTDLYCNQIPRAYGFDPLRQIQILAPMHRGDAGTASLNRMVQQELGRPAVGQATPGDRVMQIVNNYTKDVFNGDAGVVTRYDQQRQELEVDFDGRRVTYGAKEHGQLILAYAISVHKSQGSEYPAVVVPLCMQHAVMLQRNLLYTAVTRARKLVVLVGSKAALGQAVRNNRIQRRNSRLAQLVREGSQRAS